jgi:hypothetical protein
MNIVLIVKLSEVQRCPELMLIFHYIFLSIEVINKGLVSDTILLTEFLLILKIPVANNIRIEVWIGPLEHRVGSECIL